MAGHGGARVACASQRAGGYRLHSVKQLKKTTDEKQSACGADHGGIGSVNSSDVLRRGEKKYGHKAHEAGAEEHGGPSGAAGGVWITTSEGLANTNRSGSAESQGDHVS